MAFIVEDGTVVVGATSLASVAFADSYLSDRGRIAEGGWQTSPAASKQAALISASDYLETRWGSRFKGIRRLERIFHARATLTMTALPTEGETVTISGVVLTYAAAPSADTDVEIGASVAETLDNLAVAIDAQVGEAQAQADLENTLVASSKDPGTTGNTIAVATSATASSWSSATLLGGSDSGFPQSLAWPRIRLYDIHGQEIVGVPPRVREATVEYAVRAVASPLFQDPTIDPTGRAVTGSKTSVGPINTEVTYAEGSDIPRITRPYPAADRLLSEYVNAGGGTFR